MKMPPHNIETEQAVIGSMFINPGCIPKVQKALDPADFYREGNQGVCKAIFDLKSKTDLITVAEWLDKNNLLEKCGGRDYLTSIVETVVTSAGVEYHAGIVKGLSQRRKLIAECADTASKAYSLSNELGEVLSDHKAGIKAIQAEDQRDYLENAILSTSELIKLNIPEKQTLLHPWLNEDSISLVTGQRGIGKSWGALGVANAVSKGESFGPWECKKSVPCLFLDGEMPASDIVERVKALNLHSDRPNPLYIYSDALANQYGLPRAHLANESWRTKMKSILLSRKIKLWVVDNLASLAAGIDENVKKDWDPINQWLLELRFAGVTTLMLHHTNKEGGQRGTSAREDNIDISIMLKSARDYTPEDGARFIVHFTKARVATKDLSLISDIEFKLIEDESGQYVWAWKNIRKENTQSVLELFNDGMDTKAICETLGITKGRVSQIRKKAVRDGYLTPKGSLTQQGYLFLNEE